MMTTDLDKSLAFYPALFPEWQMEVQDFGAFTYHMIHCGGVKQGGFVPLEGAPGIPSHWISYVAVEDCDATVQKMQQLGGKVCVPAFTAPGVGRFAVVTDPQGALIKPFQLAGPRELPEQPSEGQFIWDELLTTDVKAAQQFYMGAFGWDLDPKHMGNFGPYTIFTVGGTMVAGAMAMPAEAHAPPAWLCYFRANDLDERTKKAEGLGARVYRSPMDVQDVGRISVLGDPAGATFALYKPNW
jgi:predicted enzyme related to lactoylglutathione lyase